MTASARMMGAISDPTLLMGLKTMQTRKFTQRSESLGGENNLNQLRDKGVDKSYTDKMECGLCWETFTATDEVFNCQKMHVFHTHCYEDRVLEDVEDELDAMINNCPTCNSPMNIVIDRKTNVSINSRDV